MTSPTSISRPVGGARVGKSEYGSAAAGADDEGELLSVAAVSAGADDAADPDVCAGADVSAGADVGSGAVDAPVAVVAAVGVPPDAVDGDVAASLLHAAATSDIDTRQAPNHVVAPMWREERVVDLFMVSPFQVVDRAGGFSL